MGEPKKAEVGKKGTLAGESYEVKESCGAQAGRWACLTHDKVFRNQFDKDTHIGDKDGCELAWICFDHGVETP